MLSPKEFEETGEIEIADEIWRELNDFVGR